MNVYGIIGFPLKQSFSQKYFLEKFLNEGLTKHTFLNFPLSNISELPELIKQNIDLKGFNVTIPYKEKIIPFLDELSEEAAKIRSVNVVKVTRADGKISLKGYNTDAYGFSETLKPHLQTHHQKALILGNGGASKSVAYVLEQLNIPYFIVSRTKTSENCILYSQLTDQLVIDSKIIINTTPLGMYPDIFRFPLIHFGLFTPQHLLYDLIYNPARTLFLKFGEEKQSTVVNGLDMLHLQAEKSWEIYK